MRLSVKLTLSFIIITTISVYTFQSWTVNLIRKSYSQLVENSLIEFSQFIASDMVNSFQENELTQANIKKVFERYKKNQVISSKKQTNKFISLNFYVTNSKGVVLFHSQDENEIGKDYSLWNDVYKTLRGQYGARSTRQDEKNALSSVYYIASPLIMNDKIVGVVSVFKPEQNFQHIFEVYRKNFITGAIVVLCLMVLLLIFIFNWITRPFERLKEYVNELTIGKNAQLPALPRGEFKILGKAIDDMQQTINDKNKIENYVQNLTHELKSPLTGINAAAEICYDQSNEEVIKKFSNNILNESRRIQVLLDTLLKISSLEKLDKVEIDETIDLAQEIQDIKVSMGAILEKQSLEINTIGNAKLKCNRFLFVQCLRNLIDNSIKFSHPDSKIEINITENNNDIQIFIKNHGDLIPAYALEKVQDKYFSLPNKITNRKSSGLGLTFCREVLHLHQGSLKLENHETGVISGIYLKKFI